MFPNYADPNSMGSKGDSSMSGDAGKMMMPQKKKPDWTQYLAAMMSGMGGQQGGNNWAANTGAGIGSALGAWMKNRNQ